jgi:CRISPR-associated endonuclease/helicase Cas3
MVELPMYAHTPSEHDPDRWHDLRQHLQETADLAGSFAASFDAVDLCRAMALLHDAGKANPRFQEYLRACHEGRSARITPHAAPAAKAASEYLKLFSLAIVGHHSGLPDPADVKRLFAEADENAVSSAGRFIQSSFDLGNVRLPDVGDPLDAEMLVRMCFSALVDADYLDTERHFKPGVSSTRLSHPPMEWYRDNLRSFMDVLQARTTQSSITVSEARKDVLESCRAKASDPRGAFRLTVPTGGGKTLAGLTFALDHAVDHGHHRVIVAIPFTSIIDQTAQVYAGVFGEGNVLEHHSAVEPELNTEGQSESEYRRRLSAENWDHPLIVTTTVQLFESLFANRPSHCRKLHNVANSVIILDEVQTLPVHLLLPILEVLNRLVERYKCTVVFCTATQPDFSGLGDTLLTRATEIVSAPERHFQALKRVNYERLPEPVSPEELAAFIDSQEQILCVLNTRADAVRIVNDCAPTDALFHLSTLMCPDHRKKVLAIVRQRLADGLEVRLVTTQVVEAGVDLDFPVVMRDLGPLDRIVQVAGRCNREGKLPGLGRCIVFELIDAKSPGGPYRTGISLTKTIVNENTGRIDQPDVVSSYFRSLYHYAGADQGKGQKIQELRKMFHFKSVAEEFRLIEDDTRSVIAVEYARERITSVLTHWERIPGRLLARRLNPYAVSLRRRQFESLVRDGLIREHYSGIWLYEGHYNHLIGIGSGSEPDPADLIV